MSTLINLFCPTMEHLHLKNKATIKHGNPSGKRSHNIAFCEPVAGKFRIRMSWGEKLVATFRCFLTMLCYVWVFRLIYLLVMLFGKFARKMQKE